MVDDVSAPCSRSWTRWPWKIPSNSNYSMIYASKSWKCTTLRYTCCLTSSGAPCPLYKPLMIPTGLDNLLIFITITFPIDSLFCLCLILISKTHFSKCMYSLTRHLKLKIRLSGIFRYRHITNNSKEFCSNCLWKSTKEYNFMSHFILKAN